VALRTDALEMLVSWDSWWHDFFWLNSSFVWMSQGISDVSMHFG